VNAHPNLTVDVGQVMFGNAVAMTGDGAAGYFLHKLYGNRWFNCDVEVEAGCGVTPIEYRRKSVVHALQWAIGLEWYLLVDDPWQVMMSTDHPNGGSFLAYPQIIALLMDRGHRADMLGRLPAKVRARSGLADISREYSLAEIAIITRAAPARMLGLTHKGHLGPGADGDVAIYRPDADKERMFSAPRYLIKAGQIVLDDGDLRSAPEGRSLHVAPEYDPDVVPEIEQWFARHYSIQFANYPVGDPDVANPTAIPFPQGAQDGQEVEARGEPVA
jgi:formylmethanofuran dehydrogenase subunit A